MIDFKSSGIKYLGIFLLLVFILSNVLFGWPLVNFYNNYKTNKFLSSLENADFPGEFKVIDSYKDFGILYGGSNHCDCEIGIIIESELNLAEFENYLNHSLVLDAPYSFIGKYYSVTYLLKNKEIYSMHSGDTNRLSNQEIVHVETGYNSYKSIEKLSLNLIENTDKNYYAIIAFDQTYSGISMRDLRCH